MKTSHLSIFFVLMNTALFAQIKPKHDPQGNLLPLNSYRETVLRGMSMFLNEEDPWFKGSKASLIDERGKKHAPYIYYANLELNGETFATSVDRFVSYPAFHHSLYIQTFIKYYDFTGDTNALLKAKAVADWNIAHSTPSDWPYGNMPYSTYYFGKPGGFRDSSAIMTDKPAMMGSAYLQLYRHTAEKKYLVAAEKIAQSLSKNQLPEGNWPFRVNPQTKRVREQYTSSVIYAVELFDQLNELYPARPYKESRDKAFLWLMENPVKTMNWNGFYEDIGKDTSNRTNYDCMDVIRYLLKNRQGHPEYVETALKLEAYIEHTFLDRPTGFEPALAIREQKACFETMGVHSAHWAAMMADFYKATNDTAYREIAEQTMNYVTYHLRSDHVILTSFTYPQYWYSCHFGVVYYLLDIMSTLPQ